jgi:hypothetical protein
MKPDTDSFSFVPSGVCIILTYINKIPQRVSPLLYLFFFKSQALWLHPFIMLQCAIVHRAKSP